MMLNKYIGSIVLCIAASVCAADAVCPPARSFHGLTSGLEMVWSDEFDGDSLNRDVWNVEVNGSGCGNHELQHYIDSPRNVQVADGNLVITARREQYGNHGFTSGRLNTNGKFAFTYGLVEARVKLPATANGLWPAVWFMGDDLQAIGWPMCGEVDLLEMGHADGIAAGEQEHLFNGAIHFGENTHIQKVGASRTPYSLQDGNYHSFYLWWTPDNIYMYVDDVDEPYLTVATTATTDREHPGFFFHKPLFLLVNLAVGGDFTGIHDPDGISALEAAGASASMYVDYIRIYRPSNQLITER